MGFSCATTTIFKPVYSRVEPGICLVLPGLRMGARALHIRPNLSAPMRRFFEVATLHPFQLALPEQQLLRALGVDAAADTRWAEIYYCADTGRINPNCLRLDPVHLQVDLNNAWLQPVTLSRAQATDLVRSITEIIPAPHQLLLGGPNRWYLEFPQRPRLVTQALAQVFGRSAANALPHGPDAPGWRTWLGEIEMLLHQHPVNQQLTEQGLPTVNSVWLWGGGAPVDLSAAIPFRMHGDDAFAKGIERLATDRIDWPDGCSLLDVYFDRRLFDHAASGAEEDWNNSYHAIAHELIEPVLHQLTRGSRLRLISDDCELEYRASWWSRRQRRIQDIFSETMV